MSAVVATFVIYFFQSRHDKAATKQNEDQDRAAGIRQDIQFLHGQQTQVLPSIESGILAIIDRQIREFRHHLGSTATPECFLDRIFDDQALFKASAMDSNLSSTTYSRMNDLWGEINLKALEFRGALRIFWYACAALTEDSRHLCAPDFTISILKTMARRGERRSLSKIDSLDELVNRLISDEVDEIQQATGQFKAVTNRIAQGSVFLGMLTDKAFCLSDDGLVNLSKKNVPQPGVSLLKTDPSKAISTSMDHLMPELSEDDLKPLRDVLKCWDPTVAQAQAE
jgi:hypothetical protein